MQSRRLRKGHILDLEEVSTVRIVFQHYFLNLSLNGWRPIDDKNGVNTVTVLLAQFVWPHRAIDDLGFILLGKKDEPKNYFYSFSKPAGDQESCANPLTINVGTDNRLVGDASTIRVVEENSGESTISALIPSPPSSFRGSPYPPRPPTDDTFGSIIDHGLVEVNKWWRDSIPQEVKEHVCPSASFRSMKKPSLKDLISSLQVAIAKLTWEL
ncbi:hypothetical protein PVK06_036109 [Gossypium arboreum]|uniref:Uncharacterized protein n=1 Tax=Gossypium arboreum TaxID=29729 RepID=A0ABR0NIM2_GOSAR|nr:hypothetical protein PVK06_036109 [Gossypium arboreum]